MKQKKERARQRPKSSDLPRSHEAESACLGAAMIDKEAAIAVTTKLSEDDWYWEENRNMFVVIRDLVTRGIPVDEVAVCEEMERKYNGQWTRGRASVLEIVEAVPSAAGVQRDIGVVMDRSLARKAYAELSNCADMIRSGELFVNVANEAEMGFRALRSRLRNGRGPQTLDNLHPAMIDDLTTQSSRDWIWRDHVVLTGLSHLDETLIGLKRGEMSVIKAKRSHGKTALAVQIASETAIERGKATFYASLEMNREAIVMRAQSLRTGISMMQRYRGNMSSDQVQTLLRDMARTDKSPWIVDFDGEGEVDRIAGNIEAIASERDLWLAVVDYAQCCTHEGMETKEREVSYAADQMKRVAESCNCHVILCSQVNDEGGARWSKEAEDRADVVIAINKGKSWDEEGEIVVEKHRNGPTGVTCVRWSGMRCRFDVDELRQSARKDR